MSRAPDRRIDTKVLVARCWINAGRKTEDGRRKEVVKEPKREVKKR